MTESTPLHVILDRYLAQYQQARRRRALISGALVLAIALTLAWRLKWGAGISAAAGALGWAALAWGMRQGRISRGQAAEQLDRTLRLEQRLVTAAECLEGRKTSELYPALLADVEAKATSPTTGYPKPWSRTSSVLVALLALLLWWPYQGRLPLGLKPPQPPASPPPSTLPTPPPPSSDQQQQQSPQSGAGSTSNTNNSQNNNSQQPPSSSANSSGASGQSSSSGTSQQGSPQNTQSSNQGQSSQGQASQSQGQNNQGQSNQQGRGQQGAGQQQGTQGQQGNSGQQPGAQGQQSTGQQPGGSQSANAAGSSQQQSGAQQSGSPQAGTSQQGTPQQAGQPQAGQGDQQALKGEIQQLLKEMSGQVKELQGQLSNMEQNPPPPGTQTDPESLFSDTTPLDPLTGAALPMQLQTDTAATKAQRRGGGTGKPSGDVGHDSPEQQAQDAQLSATPTEQAAVTRQPVPPEYRSVFERLQSTESTQSEQTP